ncbi:hypothetical protein HKD37_18G049762 [Glycine soja]
MGKGAATCGVLKIKTSSSCSSSRAFIEVKPSNTAKGDPTFTTMVKKFMDRKPKSSSSIAAIATRLIVPFDLLAKDLKKDAKKVARFSMLQNKLFGKGASEKKEKVKTLTKVKNNTGTLAMVLRSKRELLSINKELSNKFLSSSIPHSLLLRKTVAVVSNWIDAYVGEPD